MTQALLNNLNIIPDSKLNLSDKSANETVVDFAKILQDKTPNTKTSSSQTTNTNEEEIIDNNIKRTTLGELKESVRYDFEELKEVINDAIIENEIIETLSPAVEQDNIISQTNTTEENTEEQNPDTTQTNQENTITNEETTMTNDERIYQPLENPATAMMLQSQLQKHSFKENENSNTEENENNNSNFKANELTKTLKNYEDIQNNEKSATSTNLNEKDILPEKSERKLSNIVDKKVIEELKIETLEAQSAQSENGGDIMNNQSPQEQAVKAIMHADGITNSKFEFVSTAQNSKVPTETTTNKIIEQISKQIENMYNGSKVNIVLNPENLGKVSLQILNLKEGLSAQFTVTTQDAQNIIMKGLAGLKESLLAQGINVDNVTVKLQETGDNEHHSDWTEQEGSRGGNKQQHPQKQKENEEQFEQMMFEFNKNGNV